MKKIRIVIMALAIVAGASSAFAEKKETDVCVFFQQYYKYGIWYLPAGPYGQAYVCLYNIGVCTYYNPDPFDPYTFAPCRLGLYYYQF